MKIIGRGLMLVLAAALYTGTLSGQNLAGRWGFGLGAGMQQLLGDAYATKYAPGGEARFAYRLRESTSLNFEMGISLLEFAPVRSSGFLQTRMLRGSLLLEQELLAQSKVRPFLILGLGGFNFQITGGQRFNDGLVTAGTGLRYFFADNAEAFVSGQISFTSGDDLDGVRKGSKDGVAAVRTGFTFYRGVEKQSTKTRSLPSVSRSSKR